MRKLNDYSDQKSAQDVCDFLELQGIGSQVRETQDGYALWVIDEGEMIRAKEFAENFTPEQSANVRAEAEALRKKKALDARPVFTPTRARGAALVTPWGMGVVLLIAISCLVFLLMQMGGQRLWPLFIAPVDLNRGYWLPLDWSQPWRLITPSFLHFGWTHIIFNMMWLRQLGGQVESNLGTVRFLALFAVTAAISNLAQYWLFRPEFGGMSGVNYALFGFVWMHTRYSPRSGYALTSATTWLMMGWLIWCATGLAGPVANAAHAFGLIVGLALALPSYLHFRKSYKVPRAFEKGSWQDLNIHGFERFRRLYVEPFAPAWFLVIALLVVAVDYY